MSTSSGYIEVNSPFRWVGGKSRFRKQIIPLIPNHSCYVELFAGAAWVLFGKPPSDVEVLNDIDNDLITFFKVIKEKPEKLIESFEWELVSRSEFNRLAALPSDQLSDVQRAHRFYYLIMAGWGGELNYPRFQTSISDGGHGNRLFGAIAHLRRRIEPVYNRLKTVIIENLDWQVCFERYDSSKTFFYLDPPYPENGCNYANNMRDYEDHKRLAQCLASAKSKWILSSYDKPETHALYDGYIIRPVQTISGMNTKKGSGERVANKEVLIMNFTPEKDSTPLFQNGIEQSLFGS
jgi:DNA adenine methylase